MSGKIWTGDHGFSHSAAFRRLSWQERQWHSETTYGEIEWILALKNRGYDQEIWHSMSCFAEFHSKACEPNIWNHLDRKLQLRTPSASLLRGPSTPAGTWLQSLAVPWSARSVLGQAQSMAIYVLLSQIVQGYELTTRWKKTSEIWTVQHWPAIIRTTAVLYLKLLSQETEHLPDFSIHRRVP